MRLTSSAFGQQAPEATSQLENTGRKKNIKAMDTCARLRNKRDTTEKPACLSQPNEKTSKIAKDEKIRVDLSNLVTTCGMALRLEILIAGGSVSTPSVVKQCFARIFTHSTYCLGDSTHSVQWVVVQDKPGRVLGSFVLDHLWTLFNQRPSDSRNGCRAREQPVKALSRNLFQQHVVLSGEDKLTQSFSQHYRATKHAHVEGTMLTEERGNNHFSRLRHETAIDRQDINRQEGDLALADIFCQELESFSSCTRAEPSENMFEVRKVVCDREDVIPAPCPVRY